MKPHIAFIGLLIVAAQCTRPAGDATNGDTTAANPAPRDTSTGGGTNPLPAAPSAMQVSETGIGPVRAGMTVAQAEAALRTPLSGGSSGVCRFAEWSGSPPGVRLMVENNSIARVDVQSGSVATSAGARIGDTEDRVKSLYRGRVTVTPHKYTPAAHYLTVVPAGPADSAFRLIFETDGKQVTRYRSGTRPQVEYVEGCG